MKDQYVGDVSDYLKYAVLRAWNASRLSLALGWMLTEPDMRSDGNLTRYLEQPDLYRDFDPALFDGLARLVSTGNRSVQAIIEAKLLADCHAQDRTLTDDMLNRRGWFRELANTAADRDVLFLDPDNGLEVASVARGRAGSRRYVYLAELAELHHPRQAIVVYQHFPRVARDVYLNAQLRRLSESWPGRTFAVCSPRIALMVSAPPALAETMIAASRHLVLRDTGAIGARIYPSATA
jgi:hypothetical protein